MNLIESLKWRYSVKKYSNRKNYLFAGSKEGGKRLALFYSILESCKKQQVNPLDYLRDILERMPATKTSELRSLLPDQWKPLSVKLIFNPA